MNREDVEALLAACERDRIGPHPSNETLAALCRRWLAVDEADSMQVLTGPRGFGEIVCMPSLIGQRVRIVPEDGQGVES